MADNMWGCSSFRKMFDGKNNPFVKMMTEINAPLNESMKQMAAQSIESGEKWANQVFEFNAKATGWAMDTPFASIFDKQRTFARKAFESSTARARQIWQLEIKAEETAESAD